VGVGVAGAAAEQRLTLDEVQYFLVVGDGCLRQILQVAQEDIPPLQVAEREFANHKRMSENLAAIEQRSEPPIVGRQMFVRRRGIAARSGSVPPRRASRRAASRSTNAPSASRSKADFSSIPV
jgi:hypothetical protein